MSEQEIVPDELVPEDAVLDAAMAVDDFLAGFFDDSFTPDEHTKLSEGIYNAIAKALPRTTIEEAEARGAAKERERLAKLGAHDERTGGLVVCCSIEGVNGFVRLLSLSEWVRNAAIRAQGGDNAG
jgi:hypothetical protein